MIGPIRSEEVRDVAQPVIDDLRTFRDMFKRAGHMQLRPGEANYYVIEKGYADRLLRDTRHWFDDDRLTER